MRFILVLLIIAGIIAGYILFQKDVKEKESHYWMTQCKSQLSNFVGPGASRSLDPDEASLFKILLFLHKTQHDGMDISQMITDACSELNLDDSAASLIKDSLMNDLASANDLKVFDDPANLMNLEHGETAIIAAPSWKGEKLVVIQIVPPLLAPEAAQCLANLVIVPEVVRDAWTQEITPYTVERSSILMGKRFITRESHERVVAASKSLEKK